MKLLFALLINVTFFILPVNGQTNEEFVEKFDMSHSEYFDLLFTKYESDFEIYLNNREDSTRRANIMKRANSTSDPEVRNKTGLELVTSLSEQSAFSLIFTVLRFKPTESEITQVDGIAHKTVDYYLRNSEGTKTIKFASIKFRSILPVEKYGLLIGKVQLFTAASILLRNFTKNEMKMISDILVKRSYKLKNLDQKLIEYRRAEDPNSKNNENYIAKHNIFVQMQPDAGVIIIGRNL